MMAAYGDSPIVRATFDEASTALGDDLWAMVANGPAEILTQTVNTQPVMLTAGIAAWRLWLDKGGRQPAVVAGHSSGEYSALVAGVLAFTDAVPWCVRCAPPPCRKPRCRRHRRHGGHPSGLDDDGIRRLCEGPR